MYREMAGEAAVALVLADFRSDTVTRPTAAMRAAMAEAPVGDDVYDEDPTVHQLEERLATLAGKQAAAFFPTGTQSNLAALLSHCGRGEEYIAGSSYHIFAYEAGGAAVLGGIAPHPLPTGPRGGLDPKAVEAAIKPDDSHHPITRLLCLENTVSGQVQPQAEIVALAGLAHERGLSVHLDGARLFNAAVAQGRPLAELTAPVDSVSICLSKGLGAPVGSVLCGSEDLIARARRNRKLLGGGMRQVGVLAACGLHALDHHVARLADDHRRARTLAQGLAAINGVSVDLERVQSNMVFMDPGAGHHQPLCDFLAGRGILVSAQVPEMRLVTHLDVDDDGVEAMLVGVRDYYAAG